MFELEISVIKVKAINQLSLALYVSTVFFFT